MDVNPLEGWPSPQRRWGQNLTNRRAAPTFDLCTEKLTHGTQFLSTNKRTARFVVTNLIEVPLKKEGEICFFSDGLTLSGPVRKILGKRKKIMTELVAINT